MPQTYFFGNIGGVYITLVNVPTIGLRGGRSLVWGVPDNLAPPAAGLV